METCNPNASKKDLARKLNDDNGTVNACAGRGCSEEPVIRLKLRYINKKGDFCISCAAFLTANDLVDNQEDEVC